MNDKATILVANYTPESLALLVDILTPEGYTVHPANSGELAPSAVAADPPDLILLGIRPKGMDRLQVCRQLKAHPQTAHIPIFFLGVTTGVEEAVTGLELGAADYISKPYAPEELLARVKVHLSLSRATISLQEQAATLRRTNEELQAEIVERRRVEEELHNAETRYRRLFEEAPVMYVTTRNEDGIPIITDCNIEFLRTLGYSRDDVLEHELLDFYTPASRTSALESRCYQRALDGSLGEEECDLMTYTGAGIRTVTQSVPEIGPGGKPLGTRAIFTNITARTAAETEREGLITQIQEQVQRVQGILDTVPEGVLLIDAHGHVLLANPVAERDLATLADIQAGDILTHLGDRPLSELLAPPTQGLWHEIRKGSRIFEAIARPMQNSPEPEHYVLLLNDVTRERVVQHELQQQERLAAVGQLAAGIAHDFNNMLAVIVLYAQMELQAADVPDRLRAHLRIIVQETHRAADLVQQILDFGRGAALNPHPMDLVSFLKERITLFERTLPESIAIELADSGSEGIVKADPTRMQQMITNLVINARDAMPDGGGLRISLEKIRLEPHQPAPLPGMTSGPWIKVAVADTGTGIRPEALSHIFEPFFTTKKPGKGTGLGLAQVYGIVKQHNGHIGVQSQVGQGTTFTIYLPALEVALDKDQPAPPASSLGHGEIILVVENNIILQEAVASTLQRLNYRTLAAAHGREALTILEGRATEIALILSDMVMPEMGGQALFHSLRERGVTVPMVIMTGHPIQNELRALQTQGLAGWIAKPPIVADLATTLARALRGKDP